MCRLCVRHITQLFPIVKNIAFIVAIHSRNYLGKSALSRAAWSHDCVFLALSEGTVNIVERIYIVIIVPKVDVLQRHVSHLGSCKITNTLMCILPNKDEAVSDIRCCNNFRNALRDYLNGLICKVYKIRCGYKVTYRDIPFKH